MAECVKVILEVVLERRVDGPASATLAQGTRTASLAAPFATPLGCQPHRLLHHHNTPRAHMQAAPMRGAPSSVRVSAATASPQPPSAPRGAAPCRAVRHTRRPYTLGASRWDEVRPAPPCD